MKKLLILTILGIVLIGITGCKKQEKINQKEIDDTDNNIVLIDNLDIEINSKINLLSLISKENNAKITSKDEIINTSTLGEQELTINYINNNEEKEYNFKINIVDTQKPTIKYKKSLTTTVGTKINLLKGVSAIDNSKEKIKVNVEGNYNFNKSGEYKLKYVASDSSGNKAENEFILNVKSKSIKDSSNKSTSTNSSISNSTTNNSNSLSNDSSSSSNTNNNKIDSEVTKIDKLKKQLIGKTYTHKDTLVNDVTIKINDPASYNGNNIEVTQETNYTLKFINENEYQLSYNSTIKIPNNDHFFNIKNNVLRKYTIEEKKNKFEIKVPKDKVDLCLETMGGKNLLSNNKTFNYENNEVTVYYVIYDYDFEVTLKDDNTIELKFIRSKC